MPEKLSLPREIRNLLNLLGNLSLALLAYSDAEKSHIPTLHIMPINTESFGLLNGLPMLKSTRKEKYDGLKVEPLSKVTFKPKTPTKTLTTPVISDSPRPRYSGSPNLGDRNNSVEANSFVENLPHPCQLLDAEGNFKFITDHGIPPLHLAGEVTRKRFDPLLVAKPPPLLESVSTNHSHETSTIISKRRSQTSIEILLNGEQHIISTRLLQRCHRETMPLVDAAIKQILDQNPILEHHYWYDIPLEAKHDMPSGLIHSPLIFDMCCSDCIFDEQLCSGYEEDEPEKKCQRCKRNGYRCIFRTVKQESLPYWHYDDPKTREVMIRSKERRQ